MGEGITIATMGNLKDENRDYDNEGKIKNEIWYISTK